MCAAEGHIERVPGADQFEAYDGVDDFRDHSSGPQVFERQAATGRQGFSDVVCLVPQIGGDSSAFALGTVDADVPVAQQRRFLAGFFAKKLRT